MRVILPVVLFFGSLACFGQKFEVGLCASYLRTDIKYKFAVSEYGHVDEDISATRYHPIHSYGFGLHSAKNVYNKLWLGMDLLLSRKGSFWYHPVSLANYYETCWYIDIPLYLMYKPFNFLQLKAGIIHSFRAKENQWTLDFKSVYDPLWYAGLAGSWRKVFLSVDFSRSIGSLGHIVRYSEGEPYKTKFFNQVVSLSLGYNFIKK